MQQAWRIQAGHHHKCAGKIFRINALRQMLKDGNAVQFVAVNTGGDQQFRSGFRALHDDNRHIPALSDGGIGHAEIKLRQGPGRQVGHIQLVNYRRAVHPVAGIGGLSQGLTW